MMRLLLFTLLCFSGFARAEQSYYFRQYQVDHGLSHNTITACLQDRQGFMWFGTRDGLNRFDGYTFTVFRNNPDYPASIGHNWVTALALGGGQGSDQALWVGTVGGVYRFDIALGTFTLLPFTKSTRVNNLLMDTDGSLWLIMGGRLVRYTNASDFVDTYDLPDRDYPSAFCLDQNGRLWIGSVNGMLYVYDKVSGNFIKNDVFSHSSHITSRMISRLYSAKTEMGEQLLLIGTQTHGMKIFDVNRQTTKDCFRYDEDGLEISVRDFLQKSQDEVWAATTSGLIVYNLRTQEYTYIRHRVSDPFALSSDLLVNLYNDREGGIWLGTYAGGVNYYSPYRIFTKYYSYPDIEGRTMRGNIVHDICTDKFNQVWIATEDAGISRYNPATSKFINYAPNAVPGISHVNIHGLVADDDYLWVGNISGVIDRLRLPGGQPVKSYTLLSTLFQQPVNIVNMKKLDDILLVATTRGLFQYSPINDSFEHLSQFPNTRIQSIYRDYEGIIWAGTGSNGLYFYNPSTGSYGKFERDVIFPNENHSINDILEDSERQLWFATNDGIRVYNPLLRTVKHYTTVQGLPGNMVFRILPDEFGNMWITTTSGLACLNPYTDYITVYTQGHGLIMNQFNYNSGCKDAQGRIYFGTLRGMISFDPKEITTVYDKVQVALTHVTSYDGTELMLSSKGDSNSIVLTHDQSTFALGFSALSYLSPSIIQYAYRMEGLTDNWTYLKGSFTASYTNLAPGKYQFRVRAANISGVWNDETTLLSITVLQPWWLTTVARVCYVLIVVLLLAVCVYVYSRQSKHKADHNRKIFENEKEKELYQAKIKFFTNVSHEIRTPLTLIKSPLDKVMKYDLPAGVLDYLAIINKNVNWLLDLVNQLLDFRKTELDNYKLNFVKTDLSILIQEVCDRFSNAIEDKGLWLDIQIHTLNHNAFVDPESCTKIISNLLSNAVKHARTLIQVSLSFQENDKMFIIELKDDGEPIPPQIKHKIFEPFFRYEQENLPGTGLGLPLAKSLAEMHGGTLEVVEIEPFMLFHLKLPVNQSLSIQLPEKELIEQTDSVVINRSLPTVLVVEDNVEMKNYIGNEIGLHYNIITANNGKEALESLKSYSIQLIVSDIMMPVMDGFALLKTVKATPEYGNIPMILLTAKYSVQSRIEGLEYGADAYIEKPFSLDVLLAQISNLLTNRENVRNAYSQSPIAHLKGMAYTKADEHFMERLNEIIHKHIPDVHLNVDKIADMMNMSRPTLYRKIKAISDLTPNDFIRIARLKRAATLIQEKQLKIYEISEAVGFSSQSYFSRSFIKQFGMNPSEFARRLNEE